MPHLANHLTSPYQAASQHLPDVKAARDIISPYLVDLFNEIVEGERVRGNGGGDDRNHSNIPKSGKRGY